MNCHRYEIKFVCNSSSINNFYTLLLRHGFNRAYANRTINSIYFDDFQFSSVKENLAGVSDRKKFRLRWYGKLIHECVIEVKKRQGRLGSKDLYALNDIDADINFINSNDLLNTISKSSKIDNHVLNQLFTRMPIMHISYSREYYAIGGIRITIDSDINYRDLLNNSSISTAQPIFDRDIVVEIKFAIDDKITVSNMLRNFDMIPKRHSKYVKGLAKLGYVKYI